MPINMACPSCGKTLAAPDTAAGKRAKCPGCGQVMVVPAAVQQAEEIGAPSPPSSPQPPAESAEGWLNDLSAPSQTPQTIVTGPGGEQRRPCPECGELIVATAVKCRFCGAVFDSRLRGSGMSSRFQTPPPNYLAQAILVTLFCCLPFGIVAIVYAAQVNGRAQAGDMRGAMSASESAKMWCWVSFGLGFAVGVIYFIVGMMSAMHG
jgi:predicted RNA-binding Zn-ribbon protein involved in translation (DUF1610 family)